MKLKPLPGKTILFRPCIDLHEGRVRQIVGSTLARSVENADQDANPVHLATKTPEINFSASAPPEYYAKTFVSHGLTHGHIIMLRSQEKYQATKAAAKAILTTYPGIFHVGGGINLSNARLWLDCGAQKIIVTSALFPNARFSISRLEALAHDIGKEHIVLDLSARSEGNHPSTPPCYRIMTEGWSRESDLLLTEKTLAMLTPYASEFLIHATKLEGKRSGIDETLIAWLKTYAPLPTTYAGGVRTLADIERIQTIGANKITFTVGSALDLYGGSLALEDILAMP